MFVRLLVDFVNVSYLCLILVCLLRLLIYETYPYANIIVMMIQKHTSTLVSS